MKQFNLRDCHVIITFDPANHTEMLRAEHIPSKISITRDVYPIATRGDIDAILATLANEIYSAL